MSQPAPLSTLVAPVLKENTRDDNRPSKEGLIIGITCGILGFIAIIIIILVIGLKFKRKKKTREEAGYEGDQSTNSNAQLLADDGSEPIKSGNILEKYGIVAPLDAKKSTSCPDIYAVNKSTFLQIGSRQTAYEQLEQASMAGSVKYKSEDRLDVPNKRSSLSKSLKDLKMMDNVDGANLFDDDNHIYHLPSAGSKSYNRQSTGNAGKHDSGIYLVSHGSKIPLFIEPTESSHEQIEQYVSGYQSPSSQVHSDGLNLPQQHPYVNMDIPAGYKTPTSGSPRVMPKNRNNGAAIIPSGYRTPTSNSPRLLPKTGFDKKITPNQIRMEMENDDDNIYDVPKFDDDSIYTNIPNDVRLSIISQGSCAGDRQIIRDDHYQAPPPQIPQHAQRSYSIGSTKQRPPETQIYETPPNHFSNSQPSLLKTQNSEVRAGELPERPAHHSMIYDIPSRSHTLDQSTISRNNIKNEKPPPPRRNTDGIKHKKDLDAERRRSSDINANKNKYIEPPVMVGDIDDDMIYDVPSHTLERTKFNGGIDNPAVNKIPIYNHIVDNNSTTDVDNEREHYIDLEKLHRESNSHYKVRRDEENREMTYDIPTCVDRSPTSEDGSSAGAYYNIAATTSTLEKRHSAGLMKKMGYDVPSTNNTVFDPSQPSLLKLASKNLYKTPATAGHQQQHHQNKFPPLSSRPPATHEKPTTSDSDIPEYDPASAYTTRPLNKKFNESPTQGNRSMHYATDDTSIYDVPANHKRDTGSRDPPEGHDTDSIYQNVYQLEDGQTSLRPLKSNGQVC